MSKKLSRNSSGETTPKQGLVLHRKPRSHQESAMRKLAISRDGSAKNLETEPGRSRFASVEMSDYRDTRTSFLRSTLSRQSSESRLHDNITEFYRSKQTFSFAKEARFVSHKNVATKNIQFNGSQSTRSLRGASFGYGTKTDWSKMKDNSLPSPTSYNLRSGFDFHSPKPVKRSKFGTASRGFDECASILSDKKSPRQVAFPGPADYRPNSSLVTPHSPVITMRGKKGRPTTSSLSNPAPNQYTLVDRLVRPSRYAGVGFGLGQRRSMFNLHQVSTPGPGNYIISSPFDKKPNNNNIRIRSSRQSGGKKKLKKFAQQYSQVVN